MGETQVEFYKEDDGTVPLLTWLDELPPPAHEKSIARLRRLQAIGFELRRPLADYLRDGIYELRLRIGTVQHRMLYFFAGRGRAVVSHGFSGKKDRVPPVEIDRALARRRAFERNPLLHTFRPTS
ncbi:MAG: type II toxin-antitoxin system RelE/ParE family toxin [Planctomycetes bacterium]|nr:type II toxin-antitoxin system RelE/ParE family toxin [Planctomycetota bacterium]MBI3843159.1 type II toxin-antitoxin system RelE/ParE family toxin [Planctomycetota bacterium]